MSTILSLETAKFAGKQPGAVVAADSSRLSGCGADTQREIERRYEAIARDARYFQFANIPPRILRCLEQNATVRQSKTIQARLLAYYLFIGVADDEIEAGNAEVGDRILARLAHPAPCFDEAVWTSKAEFMTEALKQYINPFVYQQVLNKFGELHQANLAELRAPTMKAYIEQRKLVGSLTAEISHLLICDCVSSEVIDCRRLMRDVGAVGCLVDSMIDARDDTRAGSLSFSPTLLDYLVLTLRTLLDGTKIILKHPRMMRLTLEAIRDNFYDRRRSLYSASSPVLK